MAFVPKTPNQKLQADVLYAAFQILKEKGGEAPVKVLLDEVPRQTYLTAWAREHYPSGNIRWKALLHWASNFCIKLGFLEKISGVWKLTNSGKEISQLGKIALYERIFGTRGQMQQDVESAPRVRSSWRDLELVLDYKVGPVLNDFAMLQRTAVIATRKHKYQIREVLFATDRKKSILNQTPTFESSRSDSLSYGMCHVSIPIRHVVGELEAPMWRKFEFREDPEKHVVLLQVDSLPHKEFLEQAAKKIDESQKKQAFVFIHGYNVSFEDAARRTAQISHDLQFKGAPVFFSWPSTGSAPQYTYDETHIEWAKTDIKAFLKDFAEKSGAEKIYLIGHSMGNRGLTRALQELIVESPQLFARIAEIILAAPDIDADVFRREIAPALVASKTPVTLYASSEDKALLASRTVHGHYRAGDTSGGVRVIPGIETIDATGVDTSFLGHSYFSGTRTILSDIFYLIADSKRAADRFGLVEVTLGKGQSYWRFAPER